jgi:hypothetical protein
MPIKINFGQKNVSYPRVLSKIYEYSSLDEVYTIGLSGNVQKTFNTRKMIEDAWTYLGNNCAKNGGCNAYFAKLSKKMQLADILATVDFTAHRLSPKSGHTEEDLPYANSAGRDFALSLYAFIDAASIEALAATILHEIAHFAGATTDARSADALQAESALIPCGLKRFFNRDATG